MDRPTKEVISKYLQTMELYIETEKSIEETEALCHELEPWRVVFEFSNGVRTDNFEQSNFIYNPRPLGKLKKFHEKIDLCQFWETDVLDIGFNEGYHTIFMSKYLNCNVDAIDIHPSGKERVSKLADFCHVKPNLMVADANTYCKEEGYDLIIHCGTLYHLHDIWTAMRNTANSLRPDGVVLLETTTYHGVHEFDCRFMHYHYEGSNYWALSNKVIEYTFGEFGLSLLAYVDEYEVKLLANTGMKRTLSIFRKN